MADGSGHGGVCLIRLYLRAASFAVALFAVYVTAYPVDVHAQLAAVHDAEIHELQRRADVNDAAVQRIQSEMSNMADGLSELQGEDRVFFWVLSALTGGSTVVQVIQISKRRNTQ